MNVLSCELEEELDQNGFRHRETVLGALLGGERIGGTVYEGYAGVPIWPYHYHYGVEEWVLVLSGAPVLRDPGGRRSLTRGDLVCFPSGHLGAHTLEGPGRFIIFSTQVGPPVMSVYPDSDKLSIAPVRWGGEPYDRMMAPRSAGVDYWYGEGDGGALERAEVVRPPDQAPHPPVANLLRVAGLVGPRHGAALLEAAVLELPPGESAAPFRYEFGREEWVLVLEGRISVRRNAGEERLGPGDVICFTEGPAGAREVMAFGAEPTRVLSLNTTGVPATVCYPETGRWLVRNAPGQEILVRAEDPR